MWSSNFPNKYNDIQYVGVGQIKTISGPSAAARPGQGAERCGHFYYTKKYRGPQKKSGKRRRPLLKNKVVRGDKWEKWTIVKKYRKSGKRRLFNKTLVHKININTINTNCVLPNYRLPNCQVTKLSSYQIVGYQLLITKLLVTKNPLIMHRYA